MTFQAKIYLIVLMESNSCPNIVLAAPSQNRPGFESAVERTMPLLAARQLGDISHLSWPKTDLWNNYGAKMDLAYEAAGTELSRQEFNQELVDSRYRFYETAGLVDQGEDRQIITDDSAEISEWSLQKLRELLDKGVIFHDLAKVYVCDECSRTIGVVAGRGVSRLTCQTCHVDKKHTEERRHMFMRLDAVPPRVVLPRKSKHIESHSNNLPDRVMIERNRRYGLSLEEFDSDYSLDPKIIISMMYEYIANQHDTSTVTVVQGVSTLYNTAPYTQTVSDNLNLSYILTPNIPKGLDSTKITELGEGFVRRYLPLFLADRASDVDQHQILDLKREYDRARAYMEKMTIESDPCDESGFESLISAADELTSSIDSRFDGYDIRRGVIDTRKKLVGHMGRNGLFSAVLADRSEIIRLRDKLELVYGR